MPAFAGLARAIDWHLKNATANEKQVRALTANLFEGMRTIPGLTVLDPGEAGLSLGIVSCRCAGWSVEELGFILEESFGIVCRTGLHCAPLVHAAIGTAPEGTVRLSLSAFTRQEEIEMTLQALQKLVCRK